MVKVFKDNGDSHFCV